MNGICYVALAGCSTTLVAPLLHVDPPALALDVSLGDLGSPDKTTLLNAMTGHVLAQGELVGTYQKKKS